MLGSSVVGMAWSVWVNEVAGLVGYRVVLLGRVGEVELFASTLVVGMEFVVVVPVFDFEIVEGE